jgi:phosphoglycerate-specific signal transduction histidine kinase
MAHNAYARVSTERQQDEHQKLGLWSTVAGGGLPHGRLNVLFGPFTTGTPIPDIGLFRLP